MMNVLLLLLLFVCSVTIIIDLLLVVFWLFNRREYQYYETNELPRISILIAARNEQNNLERCLKSLLEVDYPQDKLEILVGDDSSEDDTYKIAMAFAIEYRLIKVFSIKERLGNSRGKANVLAQLTKKANGDIFFITDADVAVPSSWIKGMLKGYYASDVAIVTGITGISDNILQHIDWIFALGMVKVVTDLNRPVTAMGNNMCISRRAYQAVGGYESIPFSITEDFELFKQVRRKGFGVIQLYNQEVLAMSRGIKGFLNLLHQRKRWMLGAVQLPWPIVSLLIAQALYYPGLVFLAALNWPLAISIFFFKTVIQCFFILMLHKRILMGINYFALILYEFYSLFLSLASAIFFLIPLKINWKGRKY